MNLSKRRNRFLLIFVVVGIFVWWHRDRKRTLASALTAANRVEVSSQEGWHAEDPKPRPFVLDGRDQVEALIETLEFHNSPSWDSCLCRGDTVFSFYDGEKILATLTYHHGTHLRWQDGSWIGDTYLTDESQIQFTAWLARQGYVRLSRLRSERLEEERRDLEERRKFYGFFPDSEIGSLHGTELAQAVFRAFSATSHSWSSTSNKERRATEALETVSDADLLAALPGIEKDDEALLGFARFFFFEDYDRKIAESERETWGLRLATVSLRDGLDEDKALVMRALRRYSSPKADALLQRVLAGRLGSGSLLSKADHVDEPSLVADAALCLALRGDRDVKAGVRKLLRRRSLHEFDRAALELALAALGDPTQLKKEHFQLDSFNIGLAGLEIIERLDGAHGMDALVYGAFEHSWAAVNEEAVEIFERITKHRVWNRAPNSRSSWHRKEAIAWWEENGDEFVKRRRASPES
ncbi:MAG: hypothetical protein AAF517_18605, partial [Planctomycetota bacterium]